MLDPPYPRSDRRHHCSNPTKAHPIPYSITLVPHRRSRETRRSAEHFGRRQEGRSIFLVEAKFGLVIGSVGLGEDVGVASRSVRTASRLGG
ncbi:BQ5605_C020g09197 [Microbotryum silenes-dioicae]|uniref:BQ5605_C020g09197 protein n=1 Tax=Microbotryum silenes-dioicae TaxID=796604 RepID=A0A2X0MNT1_9BASI|nr:BQ5605_C020g09197 [Microbotryum silenes-dioicae]